jgi:quinolinate synthase
MADMAPMDQVEQCWDRLTEQWGRSVIPVTYVNSSAELKAFCGLRGGAVCTSSNAEAVMAWALDSARRVLFLPDQHLGRNTARVLGVADREISLWDRGRGKLLGGGGAAKVILWQGCCPVHDAFSVAHVQRVRRELPGVRVMVHPECPPEVLDAADEYGSTEEIIARADASEPGAQWAVGTEINLVRRLARLHRDKIIAPLSTSAPPCADMARINPGALLAVLEDLATGEDRAAVRVAPETARGAVAALERMLTLD